MERQAARLAKRLDGSATASGCSRRPSPVSCGSRGTASGAKRTASRLFGTPLVLHELVAGAALARSQGGWDVLYSVGLTMGAIGARIARALDLPVVLKLACGGEHGDALR